MANKPTDQIGHRKMGFAALSAEKLAEVRVHAFAKRQEAAGSSRKLATYLPASPISGHGLGHLSRADRQMLTFLRRPSLWPRRISARGRTSWWGTWKELADATGWCDATCWARVARLREGGAVTRERRGHMTEITVVGLAAHAVRASVNEIAEANRVTTPAIAELRRYLRSEFKKTGSCSASLVAIGKRIRRKPTTVVHILTKLKDEITKENHGRRGNTYKPVSSTAVTPRVSGGPPALSIDDLLRVYFRSECTKTRSGSCSVKLKDIAKGVGSSVSTIKPHLTRMEKRDEVRVDRLHRPNRYTPTAAMPAVIASEEAAPPTSRRRVGRPVYEVSLSLHAQWVRMGRPKRTSKVFDQLGRNILPAEYSKAKDRPDRLKKLRDRIGATLRWHDRTELSRGAN